MVISTNIINLYDNILISKYQELITRNRLTPLQSIRCKKSDTSSYQYLSNLVSEFLAISRIVAMLLMLV
uniref:RxLR effector candidate protein n=1 Tax=Hyaloperonospora arabidopsidis (strain Emoy2) TaxID=559515 RepID=M4BRA8_HYAAE